jgi:hypothetical protein
MEIIRWVGLSVGLILTMVDLVLIVALCKIVEKNKGYSSLSDPHIQ